MVFLRVSEKDPLGPLCQVWTCPFPHLRTGHGENVAGKENRLRKLRHLPKHGHTRGELKVISWTHWQLRTESRQRFINADDFVPEFMQVQPKMDYVQLVDGRVAERRVPTNKTLFERFLERR